MNDDDDIAPTLRELHWLSVHDLSSPQAATCRSVHENLPLYLSELIPPYTPSRSLRSASESFLDVPGPKDCESKRCGH